MQHNLNVPKNHSIRKKVRGSGRKLRLLEKKLDSVLVGIPEQILPHDKSWRYHLPSPQKLIDSTNSSQKLRKRFLQLLADKLIELDKNMRGKYKALLFVSLPFLSHSRIEICVDDKYFEKLLGNADAGSDWTQVSSKDNIIKELNLSLPKGYRAKGYSRTSINLNKKLLEEKWIIWKER